jgi:hypothetical protein
MKPLIGREDLGDGRVDAIFGNLWRTGANNSFMVSAIYDEQSVALYLHQCI